MNEKELAKALLNDDAPSTDAAALTVRVLARDRRRIWFLGVGCVVAWMAVVMLPWATTLPMLHKVVLNEIGMSSSTRYVPPEDAPRDRVEMLQIVQAAVTLTFLLSLATMFVAAVFTVTLIVASRRATLRQVNARLAEISAHLRALGQKAK